jgi:heme-degrading monooxygenase HmoA
VQDRPPALVTLHVFGVPRRAVGSAVLHMALDRRPLRTAPGLRFAKLLGTGAGRSFTLRDADPRHWAVLAAWEHHDAARAFEDSPTMTGWRHRSEEHLRLALRPLHSKGAWSRRRPFGSPRTSGWEGPVAALTRARVRQSRGREFWAAVPRVNDVLHRAPGLRLAIGIGDAPLVLMGTFSVWDSADDLRRFAYGTPEHRDVIRRTGETGWHVEDLFTRFGVLEAVGRVHGRELSLATNARVATGGTGAAEELA